MTWPLEPRRRARASPRACEEILVVEEKRSNLEDQLDAHALQRAGRPPAAGHRQDRRDRPHHPAERRRADADRRRHGDRRPPDEAHRRIARAARSGWPASKPRRSCWPRRRAKVARTPYFCSGCPHNTSTACPKAAARWPASAATTWRSGWTAAPQTFTPHGRRGRDLGRPGAVHRRRSTSSRTSATAPTTIPACWRSATPSPPASTSPTRSSTTTPSP